MRFVVQAVFSDEASCGIADVPLFLFAHRVYRRYIFFETPGLHLDKHVCAVFVTRDKVYLAGFTPKIKGKGYVPLAF